MSGEGVDDIEAEEDTDASTQSDEAEPGGIQVPFPFSLLVHSLQRRVVLGGRVEILEEADVADDIDGVDEVDHDLACRCHLQKISVRLTPGIHAGFIEDKMRSLCLGWNMRIKIQNIEGEKRLCENDGMDLERIFFHDRMEGSDKATPNIDISDDTGEGAVENTSNTGTKHSHGLKITGLGGMKELSIRRGGTTKKGKELSYNSNYSN